MPCSVRTTSGVPAGMVTPNAVSSATKARLTIPIQIEVFFFIYPNMRDEVHLVYWTLDVPKSERQSLRGCDEPRRWLGERHSVRNHRCDARGQCGAKDLEWTDFMVSSIHPVQRIAMRAHTSPQAGR